MTGSALPRPREVPPAAAAIAEPLEETTPRPSARAAQLAGLTPGRAALALAWPGIIEQLIRASGQTAIFLFVGQLGAVATAALGVTFQFLFLLFPIWGALSTGTVAIVSRRMGEGRPDAAADAVRQSIVLGSILSVASGVLFVIFAQPMLELIGAERDVAQAGAPLLALLGGLNVLQTISIIGVTAMRGAGDVRTPMWLSAGGAALSVTTAYALMYPLGFGLIGAAYGLTIVNAGFALATILVLLRGTVGLRLGGGPWRLTGDTTRALANVSLPTAAESALFSIGILALGALVFRLGTEAYAAHQIVSQIEVMSFLPCVGFASAASALVGQSLGMRDPKRAMKVGWAAARMAALWTSIAGVIFIVFAAQLLGAFTSDAGVVAAGIGALVIIGFAQPAQAVIFALGGALRGAGDTRYTLFATIINWFLVRLPLAVLFALVLGLGLAGIWLAILCDMVVRAGLLAARFQSGAWQRVRL